MAKITRIKATDTGKATDLAPEKPKKKTKVKAVSNSSKHSNAANTAKTKAEVKNNAEKKVEKGKNADTSSKKKPFILIRPIVYLGRYIRDSWREIRQVRWPSRKATWKLVLAIFVYTGIFIAIIMLLDALFTWLFGLMLG